MAASDTSDDAPATLLRRFAQAYVRFWNWSINWWIARGRELQATPAWAVGERLWRRVYDHPFNVRTRSNWHKFWRQVSRYMPKRLYARSLIIVITPMILLQSVVAFVFMERHWHPVTQPLSEAVVRDIAAIIDMIETYPKGDDYADVIRIAQDRLALRIDILPPDPLPPPGPKPFFSILDEALSEEITSKIGRPFWLDTVGNSNIIEIC